MQNDKLPPHSELPFEIQACQADHGETSLIVDAKGLVVAKLFSAVWDENASLRYPEDRGNAALLVQAVNNFYQLKSAMHYLRNLIVLEQRITYNSDPELREQYSANLGPALEEANRLLIECASWQDNWWMGEAPWGSES